MLERIDQLLHFPLGNKFAIGAKQCFKHMIWCRESSTTPINVERHRLPHRALDCRGSAQTQRSALRTNSARTRASSSSRENGFTT